MTLPVQAGTYHVDNASQLITILQGSVLTDGDTIVLTGTDYDLSALTNTLSLNKQITIKSDGNAILRTSTPGDFPWLGANSPIHFENVTFQFSRANSQPGYSTFNDVTAAGLVNNGQTLVFEKAIFDGTVFSEEASSTGNTPTGTIRGGALTQQGGTMVFNGETRFANNAILASGL